MIALSFPHAPKPVTGLDMAFGGANTVRDFMVPMSQIPAEFHRSCGKWIDLVSRWFFSGLPKGTGFIARDGIDKDAALRHLRTIMVSFEPKHEHKEACVAYLMSLWFSDVKAPVVSP